MTEKWLIYIVGYGHFEFEGTEEQAEKKCRDKASWERANGYKCRMSDIVAVEKLKARAARDCEVI